MPVRHLRGSSQLCWSKRSGFRCELVPGHLGEHRCGEIQWVDWGLEGRAGIVTDDVLDNFPKEEP